MGGVRTRQCVEHGLAAATDGLCVLCRRSASGGRREWARGLLATTLLIGVFIVGIATVLWLRGTRDAQGDSNPGAVSTTHTRSVECDAHFPFFHRPRGTSSDVAAAAQANTADSKERTHLAFIDHAASQEERAPFTDEHEK